MEHNLSKLNVSFDYMSDREASLEGLIADYPSITFSEQYEKLKKTTLGLATFSIFTASFNLTTPLTITTAVASVSIGNLTMFFFLVFAYQFYILKCFTDEYALITEKLSDQPNQNYYFYLMCRRAELKYKKLTGQIPETFSMHGIEVNKKMVHAPAIAHTFKSQTEHDVLIEKISTEFEIKIDNPSTLKSRIYLLNSKVSEADEQFWQANKKRYLVRQKPIFNHYRVPLLYTYAGLFTTILLIFPEIKDIPLVALQWFQNFFI